MQFEIVYFKATGNVLSALTRASDVDDGRSVAALTGDKLLIRAPALGTYARPVPPIEVESEQLDRFTIDADGRLEKLLFDPWSFGVKDNALVAYDKRIGDVRWDGTNFEVEFEDFTPGVRSAYCIVRTVSSTSIERKVISESTGSGVPMIGPIRKIGDRDARWMLVLVDGYHARARIAH